MKGYEVIIIGGGPAGMNAAVVLGRCRRKVLLFDDGSPRNIRSDGMRNYLTRDNIKPSKFIRLAREEVKRYAVDIKHTTVISAVKTSKGIFRIIDKENNQYEAKKILIATGLQDNIPNIKGLPELYGKSVFHCPYCDGWENRDKKIGVYARNKNGVELALSLKTWSHHITYFTDGKSKLKPSDQELLDAFNIPVVTHRILSLNSKRGGLRSITFSNNRELACEALFFVNGYSQHSALAGNLGCEIGRKKVVLTNRFQQTNIAGVFVAGDASRDMQFVVVAAAEGAKAGVIINKELQSDERRKQLQK